MSNFLNMTILEIVEELAQYNGTPDSEQALSDKFDHMLDELEGCQECGDNHTRTVLLNDECAFHEFFNNWTDSERTEGNIHEEQYNQYTYIGNHSF